MSAPINRMFPGILKTTDTNMQVQQVQGRVRKTVRKLEHVKYKEKLQEVGLFRMEKRRLMKSLSVVLLQSVTATE